MRIIILGAGNIGYYLAEALIKEGHDLVVIDNDEKRYAAVKESLDVMAVLGDGTNPMVMEEVTEQDADLIIAVTGSDQVNTVACLTARKYGIPRSIVRINEPDFLLNPLLMDEKQVYLVYPGQIIANEITQLINTYSAVSLNSFAQGKVEMLKFRVTSNSDIIGQPLKKMRVPSSWIFVGIVKDSYFVIPHGDTVVGEGDFVVAMGTSKTRDEIEKFINPSPKKVERVVILGGGEISLFLARKLVQDGISVRVIEQESAVAQKIANEIPEALVLEGDGTDSELLKEAGVAKSDYFISLTKDDELNILGSLLAKDLGANKVAALSRKPQYVRVIERVGIDAVMSPLTITANEILQMVSKKSLLSVGLLESARIQLVELAAEKKSKILAKPLEKIKFPSSSLVALIIRGEEVIIPRGNEQVRAGDTVMLLTNIENTKSIEKLFAGR